MVSVGGGSSVAHGTDGVSVFDEGPDLLPAGTAVELYLLWITRVTLFPGYCVLRATWSTDYEGRAGGIATGMSWPHFSGGRRASRRSARDASALYVSVAGPNGALTSSSRSIRTSSRLKPKGWS